MAASEMNQTRTDKVTPSDQTLTTFQISLSQSYLDKFRTLNFMALRVQSIYNLETYNDDVITKTLQTVKEVTLSGFDFE